MLLPALARAKAKGQEIACLNNYRQLQICWQMYAGDYEDSLPPNQVINYVPSRVAMDSITNAWLRGNAYKEDTFDNLKVGSLFPYNQSVGIYKCPADKSTAYDLGKIPRARSLSMSVYMNGDTVPTSGDYNRVWHKVTQILHAGPSRAFVFIDEHEDSIQQSTFCLNIPDPNNTLFSTSQYQWISIPGTRHGNGATITFADGHAETWRWKEPNTIAIANSKRVTAFGIIWIAWPAHDAPAGANDRDLARLFQAVPTTRPAN